jgi:hypothetical protein
MTNQYFYCCEEMRRYPMIVTKNVDGKIIFTYSGFVIYECPSCRMHVDKMRKLLVMR